MSENIFKAGASAIDITPKHSLHLAGYPFVKRDSTGVHDKLLSSALYLEANGSNVLFIGNDVIFISKDLAHRARKRIKEATGIAEKNIIVSATHTHSSPSTLDFVSGGHDELLPPIDEDFLQQLEEGIVKAGIQAVNAATETRIGYTVANATGVGTNRHDPDGASDMQVPVLLAKKPESDEIIACMIVCNMHPTILHEDSTLISGDFPGIARLQLQQNIFKTNCPVIYHIGTAGNQSPRHVTTENTFKEAERIAGILSSAVAKSLNRIEYLTEVKIEVLQKFVELPRRKMPEVGAAHDYEKFCKEKLANLKSAGAKPQAIRSAEVNWFGSSEVLNLAKLAASNSLEKAYGSCMPAEIQVVRIGTINLVAWPGEIFVEYGLEVKEAVRNTFVITLCNGDLQVYISTKEAVDAGAYEANNAIFDRTSGDLLVKETVSMLKR